MNCICCGGDTVALELRDEFLNEPLRRCLHCGHVQISRTPSPKEVVAYYEGSYSQNRSKAKWKEYEKTMCLRAAAQADYIAKYVPLRKRVMIDNGCGYGYLVKELNERGAKAVGYEYDDRCIEHARKMGQPIHKISSEADMKQIPRCTLVAMSHVVEHLMETRTTLQTLGKKSDYLFIEVPNYDLDLKDQWRNLLGHTNFYNQLSLRLLLENLGFEIVDLHRAGPDMKYAWEEKWLYRRRKMKQLLFWHTFDYFGKYDNRNPYGIWLRTIVKCP